MTDSTEATQQDPHGAAETPPDPAAATDPPNDPQGSQDPAGDDGGESANQEAARYRTRLREAEGQRDDAVAERDATQGQLEALRKQVAEDASGLAVPSGLWNADVDPGSLFDESGRLDRDKLTEAVAEAAERLGLRRAPSGMHVPREGSDGRPLSPAQPSMTDVVMGR